MKKLMGVTRISNNKYKITIELGYDILGNGKRVTSRIVVESGKVQTESLLQKMEVICTHQLVTKLSERL